MSDDGVWEAGERQGWRGLRAAFTRAAAFLVAQSASRGVHLGWLERRLAEVWTPGADGAPNGLFLAHTDTHSDRSHTDHHTDVPGKHVDVPAEPGHYDQDRPHMDSHSDVPASDSHTDQFSDGFGDVAAGKRPKLPPKRKGGRKKS